MRLRELAQARIRYGYRKLRVLLVRDGWQVGKKLIYRLYREEKLGIAKAAEGAAHGLGAQPTEAAGGTLESGLGLGFRGRSTQ